MKKLMRMITIFGAAEKLACRLTVGRFLSGPGAMLLRSNCLVFCDI
jgi:hypothetical protein